MPLIQLPESHPQVFYSLAATLIPIFLFGGVFVAHLSRPPEGASSSTLTAGSVLIAGFGGIAILAEASAIVAAVGGEAGQGQRILIVTALSLGMAVTAAGIWLPWIAGVRRSGLPTAARWLVMLSTGLLLIGAAVPVISEMSHAITLARETEKVNSLSDGLRQQIPEIRDLERRIDVYTYRLGRLKERRGVAIERSETLVEKLVIVEIETQEKLKQIQERVLGELFRKTGEEIAEAKPEF